MQARLARFLSRVSFFLFVIVQIPIVHIIFLLFLFFKGSCFPICFVNPFYFFFDSYFFLHIFLLSSQLLLLFTLPLFIYLPFKNMSLRVLFTLLLLHVIKPRYRWRLRQLLVVVVFFSYLIVVWLGLVLCLNLGLLDVLKSWFMAKFLERVYELVDFFPFALNLLVSFPSPLGRRVFN